MSLDEKITEFLAHAKPKAAQSKLEPYAELIRTLRQRRWTYLQIAATLQTEFGVTVAANTIFAFVKVRSGKGKGVLTMSTPEVASVTLPKPAGPNQPARRRFNLDA